MSRQSISILREKGVVTFALMVWAFVLTVIHRKLLHLRKNISVHPSADVHRNSTIGTNGTIELGRDCRIREFTTISPAGGHVEIGKNSLVNTSGTLIGHGSIHIGEDVLIGPNTTIAAANHTYSDVDIPIVQQEITRDGIDIADDVWIGANCTIVDGVTIEEGAVIAGGSVVTDSVPPYTVVAGVPAEKIGERGDPS